MPTANTNPQRFVNHPTSHRVGRPLITFRGSYRSKHVIPFIIHELGERLRRCRLSSEKKKKRKRCRTGAVLPLGVSSEKAVRCSETPGGRGRRRAWHRRPQTAETSVVWVCVMFCNGVGAVCKTKLQSHCGRKCSQTFMQEGRKRKRERATH